MSGRSSLLLVIRRSLIDTLIIDNCDEHAIMPIALPQLEKYVNLYRHSISVNLSGITYRIKIHLSYSYSALHKEKVSSVQVIFRNV